MKRSFIVFVCMSFSFIFPAEHNGQELLQQFNEDQEQWVQQVQQRMQQLREQRNAADANWRKLLEKSRVRQAIIKKGIDFDTIYNIRGPFLEGEKKVIVVNIRKEIPEISGYEISPETIVFKDHPRRGDKYKKPVSVQQSQHHRTNNRADRPTHMQSGNKSSKRKG